MSIGIDGIAYIAVTAWLLGYIFALYLEHKQQSNPLDSED